MKVVRTGKSKRKAWKRMITKHTFVGEGFTRKPPKFERFIRPTGLRCKKAHVTVRSASNLSEMLFDADLVLTCARSSRAHSTLN